MIITTGKELKAAMALNGVTRKKLAQLMGVTMATVSNWCGWGIPNKTNRKKLDKIVRKWRTK